MYSFSRRNIVLHLVRWINGYRGLSSGLGILRGRNAAMLRRRSDGRLSADVESGYQVPIEQVESGQELVGKQDVESEQLLLHGFWRRGEVN
jgi:hypothetical protein